MRNPPTPDSFLKDIKGLSRLICERIYIYQHKASVNDTTT